MSFGGGGGVVGRVEELGSVLDLRYRDKERWRWESN